MSQNDYIYYRQRAETELDQAHHASNAQVAKIHNELARAYLERAGSSVGEAPAGREAG